MKRYTILLLCLAAGIAAAQPETIDLRVEKQPLFSLIERIARQCDAGLSVHYSVQDRLDDDVTINARDARWNDAVDLLRRQYRLDMRLVGDRLVVEDADAAQRRQLVAVRYDTRPLRRTKLARPGPSLEIPMPGGTGCFLGAPIEAESKPEVLSFIELIRQRVAPGSWVQEAGTSIEEYAGDLVVIQTPEIHRRIAALLQELENGLTRQVEVRLWRLPVEAAGGATVLDRAALAARVKGLGAPALAFVTGDDQQSHAWAGTQRNAILDLDVVQSRMDPIITTLASGLSLDVQPLITRAGLLLTVRFSAVAAGDPGRSPVNNAAGKTITSLEQPSQDNDEMRCSVLVPDGGAAILRFGERTYAIQASSFQAALPPP